MSKAANRLMDCAENSLFFGAPTFLQKRFTAQFNLFFITKNRRNACEISLVGSWPGSS
jgi:hypothetical protein